MENFLDNIKLSSLKMTDFRQFEKLTVDFDPQLTVFIGANGSGKTTILEALSGVLYEFIIYTHEFRPRDFFFGMKDLRVGDEKNAETFALELEFSNIPKMSVQYSKRKPDTAAFSWGSEEDIDPLQHIGDWILSAFREPTNIPVFAYYACSEAGHHARIDKKETNIPELSSLRAYENAFDARSLDFETLENWLKWKYNQLITAKSKKKDPLFEAIKAVVVGENGILNMDGDRRFDDLRINYDRQQGNLVLAKGKKELFEYQLSSGEKSLLVLFADLARRCVIANPLSKTPLTTATGIVLIDEIDLHLHPSWQRKVVAKLRENFPNLQFVITTHSAAMISYFDRKHLRMLRDKKMANVPFITGRDANAIAVDVFGLEERPAAYMAKIQDFYTVLEDNLEQAKLLLNDLKNDFGADDPEIVRATSYLEIY